MHSLPGGGRSAPRLPTRLLGFEIANPVGLAAGLDKNADCLSPLAGLGFGFVELGTVTPRPQAGNPLPRLFRLADARALINRMGFNNVGVDAFLANLRRWTRSCPVGINIGKNKDTADEHALDDYVAVLRAVYTHADYVTVNISSPNTPGLRALQQGQALERLLDGLNTERAQLIKQHGRRVPLALKIAPDLDDEPISEIARLALSHQIDGIIATNTTVMRPGLDHVPLARETGGLSGPPLKQLATQVIGKFYHHLRGRIPIVGVGGIETAEDAWDKLLAGADAVQIYTALIYDGPGAVCRIVEGLARKIADNGYTTLVEALARTRAG